MSESGSEREVRRRRVFYIPGYDPVPPRRYRELYRKESAEQAKLSGYEIDLMPKPDGDLFGWNVRGQIEEAEVDATIEVLVWSDIVRGSMSGSVFATYWQMLQTVWVYVMSGALRRMMWLRKGPVLAALYPPILLCLQALVAIFIGVLVFKAGAGFLPAIIATAAAIGAAFLVLHMFRAQDGKFFVYYLMHDFAFSAQSNGATPPMLQTRLDQFADTIAKALDDDVDEVLVVGHSSGAHLGVMVLADLIRSGRVPNTGSELGFLSLGHVVPMVSFLKDAGQLRADLRFLSTSNDLTWVDVSAPGDGCCFALCDPVAVSGVAPKDKRWPLVLSAAFTQTLSDTKRQSLRWRFFRLHFQYLCAFDQPGQYDYFRITAGPLTLAARFSGRAPSRSRIDVPVSKFTSISA